MGLQQSCRGPHEIHHQEGLLNLGFLIQDGGLLGSPSFFMFTGIVEERGLVESVESTPNGVRLRIQTQTVHRGTRDGDSIAVNGCCLTVVRQQRKKAKGFLEFDLLNETWKRTSFPLAKAGDGVNLERALSVGGRLGGHFVTGHVDGVGRIVKWEKVGKDHLLQVETPADLRRYLLPKGSIAVDGISLTLAKVLTKGFQVWIIPHTLAVTTLGERHVGDRVNLEVDMIGKFVDRLLAPYRKR